MLHLSIKSNRLRSIIFFLFIVFLTSCYTKNVYEYPLAERTVRDTIVVRDTVIVLQKEANLPSASPMQKTNDEPKPVVKKDPSQPKPVIHMVHEEEPNTRIQVKISNRFSDTTYHYYKNSKQVSVKITPQNADRHWTILYDPQGNETYRMESVRMSYQVSVNLKFHDNGAVREAKISTNPGASMYWYETYITFSTANEPEWRRNETHPQRSLEIPVKEYWDRKTKNWVKQEMMECNPPR